MEGELKEEFGIEEGTPLLALPPELLCTVMHHLDAASILSLAKTCRQLRTIIEDMEESLWRKCEGEYGLYFLPERYRQARRGGRRIPVDTEVYLEEPLWQERAWTRKTLSTVFDTLEWFQTCSPVRELTDSELREALRRWPQFHTGGCTSDLDLSNGDNAITVSAFGAFLSNMDVERAVALPLIPFFLVRPMAFYGSSLLLMHDLEHTYQTNPSAWMTFRAFIGEIEDELKERIHENPRVLTQAHAVEFFLWAGEALHNLLTGCDRGNLQIPFYNFSEVLCNRTKRLVKFSMIGFVRGCGEARCTCSYLPNFDTVPPRCRQLPTERYFFTPGEALWTLGEMLRNGLLEDYGLFYRVHPIRTMHYYTTGHRSRQMDEPAPSGLLLDPTVSGIIHTLSRGLEDDDISISAALTTLKAALADMSNWLLDSRYLASLTI